MGDTKAAATDEWVPDFPGQTPDEAAGATPEPDGDENSDGDEDADDDADASEETVESLKAERAKMQRALAKANRQAQKWRETAQGKTDTEAPAEDEGDKVTRQMLDDVRQEAATAVEAKYKTATVRAELTRALQANGMELPEEKNERAGKVTAISRLLDMDDIDVDENGDVLGLDEQIEDLKEQFPGLFSAKPKTRKAPRVEPGARTAPAENPDDFLVAVKRQFGWS